MPPEKKKIKQGGIRLPNDTDLNWRVKPEDSLSDWTIQVIVEGSEEKKTYHVHRHILSLGKVRSDYFRAIFHASVALAEKANSTSVLRLSQAEAKSVPRLLDHLYGLLDDKVINEEFENNQAHELIDLLSLADYLQTKGMDLILALEFKHQDFDYREFKQFLFMYLEKCKEFGFRKETDSVVASKMSELITRGKFDDPEDCPVLPTEFLSQVLKTSEIRFIIGHLKFFDRVMEQQKALLPEDFFETTFDEGFRASIEEGAHAEELIRDSLLLMSLEYHVECQLTPFKKWCRKCLYRGFRELQEECGGDNPCQLLLDVFGNNKDLLLKTTDKIPVPVILEMMFE